MIRINLNDIAPATDTSKYLLFNGIENIASVVTSETGGSPFQLKLSVGEVSGDTCSYTLDGVNMTFPITSTDSMVFTKQLMNSIKSMNRFWKITNDANVITILDKVNGGTLTDRTFPSYITQTYTDGTNSSELYGKTVDLNVNDDITLSKLTYSNDVKFNLSGIMTDKFNTYSIKPEVYDNTSYTSITEIDYNGTYGFEFKDNLLYFEADRLSLNENRKRFIYQKRVDFSIYSTHTGTTSLIIRAILYNGNTIDLAAPTLTLAIGINDYSYSFDFTDLQGQQIKSISIILTDYVNVSYDLLRLINLSYKSYRVTYRNSYGGIDFIDFIGGLDVDNNAENVIYSNERINRWDDNTLRSNYQTWDVNNEYTFSLTSHIVTPDYLHIFEEMIQSKYIWLELDGLKYRLVVDTIDKEELQFGVYKITCSFRYKNQ